MHDHPGDVDAVTPVLKQTSPTNHARRGQGRDPKVMLPPATLSDPAVSVVTVRVGTEVVQLTPWGAWAP